MITLKFIGLNHGCKRAYHDCLPLFLCKGAMFEDQRLMAPFHVAIDDINRDPNVLPGIRLQAIVNVTKPQDAFDNLKAGTISYMMMKTTPQAQTRFIFLNVFSDLAYNMKEHITGSMDDAMCAGSRACSRGWSYELPTS